MASAASLSIFGHLFASVAEEMGLTLRRTAYSPNIKERLDFSCALFWIPGGTPSTGPLMLAQAAHIPVHLGAMPASVRAAVDACSPLAPGDVILLNDPYRGGNHLPDLTMVTPIFASEDGSAPRFLAASRAHHADVGGMSPGSMPLSIELFQEGIIIPPLKVVDAGRRNEAVWQLLLRNVRTPVEREGDLTAQLAAHKVGEQRMLEIIQRYGLAAAEENAADLIAYAERLTRQAIAAMPDGRYSFEDFLDNDGQTREKVRIAVTVTIRGDRLAADFAGTAPATRGNVNAVPAITESAVIYCLRCAALALLAIDLPMNEGALRPLALSIPPGSLLDPPTNAAVAAGNVETSQRIVDVVFGALSQALPALMPAASQGTMNNVTFGGSYQGRPFAYYETIGGGAGAGPGGNGGDGLHVHMSNTLNTPVEALEYAFPLQVTTYSLRRESGGRGRHRGGDGLVRRIRFDVPVTATLTSERRQLAPYGLRGGQPGQRGENRLIRDGQTQTLPGKVQIALQAGDEIEIATPGGGGWGEPR